MHAAPALTTPAALDIRPLTTSIGATIHDLELRHASDDQVADVRRAVLRHRVVFLRGQSLDDEALRSVARRFGALARSPLHHLLGRDTTTSVIEDTAERPPAGFAWHTDLSWIAAPPSLGFLHALEIPAVGGDTIWSNQVAALDSLPDATRDLCLQLRAEHRCDPSLLASVERHHGAEVVTALRRAHAPVTHPLVRCHPETGEGSLFLSPMYLHHLVGVDRRRGAGLLGELDRVLVDPHLQVRWRWAEGDLAIWDERSTCHRALVDHHPQRRRMRRCVVAGTAPVPA